MNEHRRIRAEIDLHAVEQNFARMRELIDPKTKMIAVVKTDGYGHGAVPVAKLTEEYDYIWGYAVAVPEEAFELREQGIQKPILILGYTFPEYYEEMAEKGIRPAVFQLETAKALSDAAVRTGKTIYIHIALDTGMNRIGFTDTEDSADIICEIAKLPGLQIEGLFTHFAKADECDKSHAMEQFQRYQAFDSMLSRKGISIPLKHVSNSAALMELPNMNLDIVRAGISIYGIYPSDEMKREQCVLSPVMSLISHIVYLKKIKAGSTVSYGGTFTAPEDMLVATIPVGYGDGYPRSLSGKGFVLIRGKKAPILGRICMDQFMVDVSEIPGVSELDEVVLLGRQRDAEISIDTLGELSGRFPYEFVCDIGKRVPRVYRKK